MSVPSDTAAVDLLFADWGSPVQLEAVTVTYDVTTGLRAESVSTANLVAIVSQVQATPSPETGGLHLELEVSFVVRTVEMPTTSATEWRIRHRNIAYTIIRRDQSADGLTCRLFGRKN